MNKLLFSLIVILCIKLQVYAQVGFTVDKNKGCAPLTVTFTNTSAAGNYYEWNFGDNSPVGNEKNPVHIYNSSGWKNVYLVVYDTTGGNMNYIGYYGLPGGIEVEGANLYMSADTACPGEKVSFNVYPQGGSNYQWNFGDGSTTSEEYPSHSYSAIGTYTVSVTYNSQNCGQTTLTKNIVILNNAPANAKFNFSNKTVCPGEKVEFYPQNWNGESYSWNFGDGSNSNMKNPNHVYTNLGTYSVSLTIKNFCGNTKTYVDTIKVMGNLPFYGANMNVNPKMACPGDEVDFRHYSSQAISQVWNFGDGSTSDLKETKHVYTAIGNYNITLKLTNGCGNDTTISENITVGSNVPYSGNVGMNIDPNNVCPGDIVRYYAPEASSYLWNFGDGTTSNLQTPTHTYSSANTYTVTLTLANSCGNDTMIAKSFTVSSDIVPKLEFDENWGMPGDSACPGDSVLFYAFGGKSYKWEFGDGSSTTQTTPLLISTENGQFYIDIVRHPYSATGTYKVKLTYTNGCGNSAMDSVNVTIGSGSPASGGMAPLSDAANACEPIQFLSFGGVSYKWVFGDGDSVTTTQSSVSHTYANPGEYNVKLTFTNGCGNSGFENQTININGINPSVTKTNVSCPGGNNGIALVSTMGGKEPLQFKLDGGSYQSSNSFTGLIAGTYNVTVKDANGCIATSGFTIEAPAAIVLTYTTVNSSCGNSDGSATVAVSGGTTPYTYSWSTGSTISSAANLASGAYSILVTDKNNCTAAGSVAINDASGPTVTFPTTFSPVCSDASSIALTGGSPTGGSYSGNGVTGGVFNPAAAGAGTHTIVYTYSSGGCTSSANQSISVNAVPVVTYTNASYDTVCSTLAAFPLTGGSPAGGVYSGNGVSGGIFNPATGLGAYTITYTFTNASNCVKSATASVLVQTCATGISEIVSGNNILVYPNPFKTSAIIEIKDLQKGTTFEMFDMLGKKVLTETLLRNKTQINKGNLENGLYFYRIVNGRSSIANGKLIIE